MAFIGKMTIIEILLSANASCVYEPTIRFLQIGNYLSGWLRDSFVFLGGKRHIKS